MSGAVGTPPRRPSVARLIHLLIEERAKVISHRRQPDNGPSMWLITEADRNQARREIEREVLGGRS